MTFKRACCSLTTCAALLVAMPGLAQNGNPYLSTIPIERADPEQSITDGLARLTLHVHDADLSKAALSGVDGVEIVASDEKTVSIIGLVEKPTIRGQPDEKFRHNTFVIDFVEEPVSSLSDSIRAAREQTPPIAELVTYVHDYIANKTYSRSFDLASRVAESREGDCTEHAVLLAALARSSGYYARVIFGTLILDTGSESYAFSHAWTEIHDGLKWQIRDATMPEADRALQQIRYLPMAILDDEGPGYLLALVRAMQPMPARITGFARHD